MQGLEKQKQYSTVVVEELRMQIQSLIAIAEKAFIGCRQTILMRWAKGTVPLLIDPLTCSSRANR